MNGILYIEAERERKFYLYFSPDLWRYASFDEIYEPTKAGWIAHKIIRVMPSLSFWGLSDGDGLGASPSITTKEEFKKYIDGVKEELDKCVKTGEIEKDDWNYEWLERQYAKLEE